MRIGVISDSHGNKNDVLLAIKLMGKIDYLIHLGDYFSDISELGDLLEVPFSGVVGNVDPVKNAPEEDLIELAGKKIFICHGHKYGVKHSANRLYYKALEVGADIVLFGHTHSIFNEKLENINFFNPGSVSRPRCSPRKSYGIVEINENIVNCETFYFE